MGYHTDFDGEFKLDRPLAPEHKAFLEAFNKTRRMVRDASKTEDREDPIRKAAGLPVGTDGAYFVGEEGFAGQNAGTDVLDNNRAGGGQPGLWCQWVPNEDGTAIVWDTGEKFYEYSEWIAYLIEHFLEPWGYKLNGVVEWNGEEDEDVGRLHVKDNLVAAKQAEVVHPEPNWG
jgi:hypothetical protein